LHALPCAHGAHGPPQSTSVSLPSSTPSAHESGAQTFERHVAEAQSAFTLHASPGGHGAHEPPQSTSVSSPFFLPSAHETGAHWFAMHEGLVGSLQSASALHSTQVPAAWQTFVPPLHGVPSATGVLERVPALHASVVQSLPSFGTFVSSSCWRTAPAPSQTFDWQLPATCFASGSFVPFGWNWLVHWLSRDGVQQTPYAHRTREPPPR
jgi:hypothetical protein